MPNEECQELKNLKYKTMLLGGNKKNLSSSITKEMENFDLFLEEESEQNKKESWNKLDKSIKMSKINEYIKILTSKHTLTAVEIKILRDFLSSNLDKKNLYKNKDVEYVKELGKLENIPNLHFNNTTRKFSLKKAQAVSSSKSLGPPKTRRKKTSSKANKSSGSSESKLSKLNITS